MSGYSWVSIVALLCYLFLFLTFLPTKQKSKVIRAFMTLMVIMILWVGGSFAMRTELWPGIVFWHHVSVLGMTLMAAGYFQFTLAFLEEKHHHYKQFWFIFHILLFAVNYFTGLFIPEPVVSYVAGKPQFVYTYTWHIYVFLLCIMPCLVQLVYVVLRRCKGNRIAYQQLKPLVIGLASLLIGHVAATLPMFSGVPLDIASGIINVLFVFYALYKKRLFKMTVLFSSANYLALSLVVCAALFIRFGQQLIAFLSAAVGMGSTAATVMVTLFFLLMTAGLYFGASVLLNAIFINHERKQQRHIDNFAEGVTHCLNTADILQSLTDTIHNVTRLDRMLVFVQQLDGDYRVEHTTNLLEEKNYYLRADHPLVSHLIANRQTVSLPTLQRTTAYRSMWEKEKKLFRRLNADTFIPILSQQKLVGLILLPEQKDKQPYHRNDLALAQQIAEICATPLQDASVYERAIDEARTDKLTGLVNRKYFFELLDQAFLEYQDSALSLCIFNLDDFKRFNQVFGNQAGDSVLQRIAGILYSCLSEPRVAARIGGKEFAVLLPGFDIHSAKLITEDLAAEIGKVIETTNGQTTSPITVSAGICAAPYMASSAMELFQNAETAVYMVKRSGKNAVLVYSSEILRQENPQYRYSGGYHENASTIYALTAAIDAKDHYTFRHSQNVAYYAEELGKAVGLAKDLTEIIREAALLHDIGKIGIREDILNKPGKLTPEEFENMKSHVENAVNIIRHLPSLDYVIPTVLSHHERYDGLGYPRRLQGEDIPIMGRILCIADSFDAMTSQRPYRMPLPMEEAVAILRTEAGKQFDPKLVLTFIEQLEAGEIRVLGTDSTEEAAPLPYL